MRRIWPKKSRFEKRFCHDCLGGRSWITAGLFLCLLPGGEGVDGLECAFISDLKTYGHL